MKKILSSKIISVSIVVLTAALVFSGCSSEGTSKDAQNSVTFTEGEVTEDTVKAEIEGVNESGYKIKLNNISKIEVIEQYKESDDLPDIFAVSVFYTFDAWDNEDVVNTSAASSLEIFRRLFAHPQVVNVAAFSEQEFTDQYGNTESSTAVKFMMDRETADKIDWDGLKGRVLLDYKALYPLTDYLIHSAIQKDLK